MIQQADCKCFLKKNNDANLFSAFPLHNILRLGLEIGKDIDYNN